MKLSPPKANPNNSFTTRDHIYHQTRSKWFLCGRTTLSIHSVRIQSLTGLWLRPAAFLAKSRLRSSWSKKLMEAGLKTELQIIIITNNTRTIRTKTLLLATMSKTKRNRLFSKPKHSSKKTLKDKKVQSLR